MRYSPRPAAPCKCPTCQGTESPRIFTQILGWECLDCRAYRRTFHQSPANRLTETTNPAV